MMNKYPRRELVERVKAQFPTGCRVTLVQMDDWNAPDPGTQGTVVAVDDIATIHVKWDNGSTLGAVYGEDVIRKVERSE